MFWYWSLQTYVLCCHVVVFNLKIDPFWRVSSWFEIFIFAIFYSPFLFWFILIAFDSPKIELYPHPKLFRIVVDVFGSFTFYLTVVYFYQHLGDVHSKHWSKYIFLHVLLKTWIGKKENEKWGKQICILGLQPNTGWGFLFPEKKTL